MPYPTPTYDELLAIVKDLSNAPKTRNEGHGYIACEYCWEYVGDGHELHANDCLYYRALNLIEGRTR